MSYDAWSDPGRWERDPGKIGKLLRHPSSTIQPMEGYLERIEMGSGADLAALRRVLRSSLLFQNGADHLAVRRLIAPFFREASLSRWQDLIDRSVAAALDRLEASPRPDLVRNFASPFFLSVLTRIVGIRDDGSGQLLPMIAHAQRIPEPLLSVPNLRRLNAAIEYLLSVMPEPEAAAEEQPHSLLAYLHHHRDAAPAGADLRNIALVLLLAANTATQTLGLALHGLLTDAAALWEDAARAGWAARELELILSRYPATLSLIRVAADDIEIDGCPYARGQVSIMDMTAANAVLRSKAPPNGGRGPRGMPFGTGPRKCPGEALARMMIRPAIPALARRFPRLTLHKNLVRFHCTPMVQAPLALPCDLGASSHRLSARLWEVREMAVARRIVSDNGGFGPPTMERHLTALARTSGHDLSEAITIARNAMFFMEGDRHAALRRIVAESLGGNRLRDWHEATDAVIREALCGLARSRSPDLVIDFAEPVFRGLVRPILGLRTGDDERFDRLAPTLQDVLEPWLPMRELLRLQEVFRELLALMDLPEPSSERTKPSLLTSLMATPPPRSGEEDLKALVLVLYGASFNLSHTLGNVLHWILTRPSEDRQGAGDPDWTASRLEQMISLCASPKYIYRMARQDTAVGDLAFAGGDTLRMRLLSINCGVSTGNLAFGHGLHRCVGAALSRMMLRRAVPALFAAFPGIALVPQAHEYFNLSQTVAMKRLPCRLGPDPTAKPDPTAEKDQT